VVEACRAQVQTEDATLQVESDTPLQANRGRLQQLLENLFRNAVEHGGPSVTVRVGPLPNGFYVEDTGTGIPEADREKVFEASYTTSEAGTGLGLSIAATVADAHGWTITATDGETGGARFELVDAT
jgi:signal transduction histidine kinase